MALPALKPEPETFVEERLARLEATVEHIQSDATEIKTDLRRMEDKFDKRFGEVARRDEVGTLSDKVDERFREVDARFDKVDARFQEVDRRFDAVIAALHALEVRMEQGFREFEKRFGELGVGRALDRVWWLLMCGALLGVMAKGFHWL